MKNRSPQYPIDLLLYDTYGQPFGLLSSTRISDFNDGPTSYRHIARPAKRKPFSGKDLRIKHCLGTGRNRCCAGLATTATRPRGKSLTSQGLHCPTKTDQQDGCPRE